ncbi:MAG: isoprenoid biosynthesis glyoxalase ElbB [Porticoccaceae bacterium]|nr:isoprenoid biosynthesis glyoxalase ElbB [Pseudomonadales bacterium]MCP5172847.1 isoprenoid biosynthesis glyoxalase ElbB [Pseudomonadales bacterium]MCP5302321.1 isoprenoid biosynthesis glyoxalase ElbB [Pseudomonadales bacterium]
MSKKVAVVLSGCGVFDGAEIYESVITLLRLDQAGAEVQCFAPDIEQMHVVNHLTGEVAEGERRNVLVEAARIVRGEIKSLVEANAEDFDALIVPGGFGAAKNLSDFAVNGSSLKVNEDFQTLVKAMHGAGKPVGLVCIAPAMSGVLFGEGVQCTIGNDADTAAAIDATGAHHRNCAVEDICVDEANKLVTTPAYMLANRIGEAVTGINKLVDKVLDMV